MAVTVLNNPAGLRLKFDLGKDDSTGKTKVKSKTFSNVKHSASNEDVYEVASAIESLQQYPVLEIAKIDNTTLAQIHPLLKNTILDKYQLIFQSL